MDISTKQVPHLRLRKHYEKGVEERKSQIIREFAMRLCLLIMLESTSIKSHEHGSLILS